MTSILVIIEGISGNQIKCKFLKSHKVISNSLSILKKNDAPHNLSISDILDSKKSSYLNV